MKLSVIIVSYNTNKLLIDCLKSLKSQKTDFDFEVIIVDNGSEDQSAQSAKKYISVQNLSGKVIESKENLGFSKANNLGIEVAKGEYILLLNSDTVLKCNVLQDLMDFAHKHPDAGIVAPQLLNTDGSVQKSVRKLPTLFGAVKEYWLGMQGEYEPYQPKKVHSVECVTAAAFLISPQALKKVGNLNEKYFFYYEDIDYCRRVIKAGLKIYYQPQITVKHLMGESGKKLVNTANQWRRLKAGSRIYHGRISNFLIYLITSVTRPGVKRILASNILWLMLVVLLTFGAVKELIKPGYFYMQDDLQAFRIHQMDKCFSDFQIPCRWVPDAGYRYGYPQFNYYPPLVYYAGEIIHKFGFQFIDTVKILFVLGYILSAAAMFALVSRLSNRFLGLTSALLYTYVPYKALEVYVRGALSEFWALIFFPLIFLFIYEVIESSRKRHIVYLAASIAGLMTTHLLSAIMLAVPAAVWTIYWLWAKNNWKKLIHLAGAAILGAGLAAFYVLPVVYERKFVHMETLLMGYFDWRKHFVGLYRLLISREWGYGSSGFPEELLNLSTGIIQWVGAALGGVVALFKFRTNRKVSLLIILLIVTELAVLFLIHPRSNPIWEAASFLTWLQFPWRFLAVSIFLLCLIIGLGMSVLKKKYAYLVGIVLILAAIVLNYNFFRPREWYDITDADKFSGSSWEKQLTISIFDYLPIYAKLPPVTEAPDTPEVISGKTVFQTYLKGSNFQTGKLIVYEDSTIRLPLFDFPGMVVYANGEVVNHVNNDCRGQEFCLGLITFNLSKGEYSLYVELTNTRVRSTADMITVVSFIVLIFLLFRYEIFKKS
jgi:GT2 family glycosyltransferase